MTLPSSFQPADLSICYSLPSPLLSVWVAYGCLDRPLNLTKSSWETRALPTHRASQIPRMAWVGGGWLVWADGWSGHTDLASTGHLNRETLTEVQKREAAAALSPCPVWGCLAYPGSAPGTWCETVPKPPSINDSHFHGCPLPLSPGLSLLLLLLLFPSQGSQASAPAWVGPGSHHCMRASGTVWQV